jgi:enoyl-CoA hydratase/carnithine racemase
MVRRRGQNPEAIRSAKRLANLADQTEALTILEAESREQGDLIGTPNQMEAVMAGMQKRPPRFQD